MKLAIYHAATLQTALALARWRGRADTMPQRRWQQTVQDNLVGWLEAGGCAAVAQAEPPRTKTAARGRRSLASQGDSNEEFNSL